MKKLLVITLALVMVLSSVSVFAAKTEIQPTTQINVPADLQVSPDATTFVDRLGVRSGEQIAVRASLNMEPVRNQFNEDYDWVVGLFPGDTAVLNRFRNNSTVTGNWTLTLTYPSVLTIPDAVINGSNMDGFNDDAKLIFAESDGRIFTPGNPNNTLVISVKVKDGITVGYLKDNLATALGDMTFTATGVVVANARNCELLGTISGTTRIESTSHFVEYDFDGIDLATGAAEVKAELYVRSSGGYRPVQPEEEEPSVPSDGEIDTENVADPKETGVADHLNIEDHMIYLEGYPDGTIRPEHNVTRAEATTMLYRLLRPEVRDEIFTTENQFGDVTEDLWYNKAVSSMAKGGFVNGYEDGNFYGDNSITRAELVAIVARFAKVNEGDATFTDVDDSHWAYENIVTAVANGWINGYEDGSFKPEQYITRAEAATIINRVLSRGVKEEGLMDGVRVWPDNPEDAWYYYEMVEATNEHDNNNTRPNEIWEALDIVYHYDIEHYERP